MASGMPELGSKISLISKADIRYEGRLFTVDPQECTIALASVRSFGTEDRESQYPVAPQNQVYEYILFRGSDIKDIRVINSVPPVPNDPAIMQLSVPPSMGSVGPGGFQQSPFGHPTMSQAQYPPYHPMGGLPSNLRPVNVNQQATSMLEMITSGSRSETPLSNLPRKSPTMEQGTQAGPNQIQQGAIKQKSNNQGTNKNVQNRPNPNQREPRNERQQNNEQNKMPRPRSQNMNNNNQQNHQQQQQQPMQQQINRQGWNNNRGRGSNRGNRGRGGFTGRPQPQGTGDNRTKNTLKFDNDYDFEQANTEFEELRSQLAKAKISDSDSQTEVKKPETKADIPVKEVEVEEDPESLATCYDKAKSFFDNISCEAVERSKGRSQRTDWKTERKLNSETFGVSSTRRGGYRGRGYWNGGTGGNSGGPQQGWRGHSWRGGHRGNRGSSQHRQRQNNQVQPGSQKMVSVTGWD